MNTVTVSPKYQVVIPRAVRESLGLKPGQKMHVWVEGNRIEFVPLLPMKQMRGFAKGIDTTLKRDRDRV